MRRLTDIQRKTLREHLIRQGLSFKPLQDEMVDHFACELEVRMSDGQSFEEAWHQSMDGIPADHFQIIQIEIMQSINKRFTWSQALSFLALGFLFISTLFKILHLQFAGEVLLVSFAFMAAALMTASITGIASTKEKKGAQRLLGVVAGVILALLGYSFKILHLPAADPLILLAVPVLVMSLLLNTISVYQTDSGGGNLLTFLHEKHTPGIERFLLLLLVPVALYEAAAIISGARDFIGNMVLLVVIFAGGLQFIALTWRGMEKSPEKRSDITLIATIVACVCLGLPFLGPLVPFQARIVVIMLFSIVSPWLAYRMEEEPKQVPSQIMVILMALLFIAWGFLRLNLLPMSSRWIFFNIPLLFLLMVGLFLSRRHGTVRAYLIVSIASYILEYLA